MVKKEVEHAIQRVYMYTLVSSKRKKKKEFWKPIDSDRS